MSPPTTAAERARRAARREKLREAAAVRSQADDVRKSENTARIAAAGRAEVHARQRLDAALIAEAIGDVLRSRAVAPNHIERATAMFLAVQPNLSRGPERTIRNRDGRSLVTLLDEWLRTPAGQPWIRPAAE